MDYYTVKDIMERTGCPRSYCYEILVKLRELFEKEYPNTITIRGKIPKWYFEKKIPKWYFEKKMISKEE